MNKKVILTGIIGFIGACFMYTGDMFLYFTNEPILNFEEEIVGVMGDVSQNRLIVGGLLAPVSTLLYMIGFYHIYLLIKPANGRTAAVIFILLCFGILYGGAFHSHFTFLGFISSFENAELLQMAENYSILNFNFMFIPSLIAYICFAYLVITKKTFHPRWMIVFTPIVLFWFAGAMRLLPQPFMMLIAGGWYNIVFVIFFSISTILAAKNGYGKLEMVRQS